MRRPALRPLEEDDDEQLATAACLTRMLTEDALTGDELLRMAGVDLRLPTSWPASGTGPSGYVRWRWSVSSRSALGEQVEGDQVARLVHFGRLPNQDVGDEAFWEPWKGGSRLDSASHRW